MYGAALCGRPSFRRVFFLRGTDPSEGAATECRPYIHSAPGGQNGKLIFLLLLSDLAGSQEQWPTTRIVLRLPGLEKASIYFAAQSREEWAKYLFLEESAIEVA